MRTFSRICRIWSLVFLAVGLLFAFFPAGVASALTALGASLGLPGTIPGPGGTLWWVLSLSLMATITVLADACARRPPERAPYVALMTAKLVSTFACLGLAAVHGPAWVLCAVGDGFVALTLCAARRGMTRCVIPRGFGRVWGGAGPHHEEYFAMIDLEPERALWLRYTLLDGKRREAAVQAVLFGGEGVQQHRRTFALDDLSPAGAVILPGVGDPDRFSGRPQVFHCGDVHLDTGNLLGSAGPVSWDLAWTGGGHPHPHGPRLASLLPVLPGRYDVVALDARFSGRLTIDGKVSTTSLAGGMVGHIHGRRMPLSWVWVHCNAFEDGADASFDGLSAFVTLIRRPRGPLSSFVLRLGDRRFTFSSLRATFHSHSEVGENTWAFSTESGGVHLEGRAELPPVHARLDYEDTDGSTLLCRNSRLSRLQLRVSIPSEGTDRTLTSARACGFEIVTRP